MSCLCEDALVPVSTVPCHDGDPAWGDVFENIAYPMTFVLAGSSASWNVDTSDPADVDVRLCNVYTENIASFTFTRVTPNPTSPLVDGDLVTVTVTLTEPVLQTRPLYWEDQTSGGNKVSYVVLTYTPSVPNIHGDIFSFSSAKRCCDVHINFVPALAGPPPSAKPPLTFLCMDARPLDWATPVDIYRRIVWPNWPLVPTTPALQKMDVVTVIGEWVWNPDFTPVVACD